MLLYLLPFVFYFKQSPITDDLCEVLVQPEGKTNDVQNIRVMIINPEKKKEYTMVKRSDILVEQMALMETMKKVILSCFPHDVPKPAFDNLDFGYVEPGHGLKGKKEWILDDEDAKKFVDKWRGKKNGECTLWCFSKGKDKKHTKRSRSKSPGAKPKSSQYDSHIAKMAKVDDIYQNLDKTHGSQYTPEQKRAWAHMIQLGKHSSQMSPPNKRFFQTSMSSVDANPGTLTRSPGKKIKIRSECIDQLQKWHELLNCGAITQEQYDEFQDKILKDIRQL